MDIYAKKGTKVKVINLSLDVSRFGGNDSPVGILKIGKEYTVERTEVHSMHTKVILVEFPDKKFNSCHFE